LYQKEAKNRKYFVDKQATRIYNNEAVAEKRSGTLKTS
jgi:hypothetical protein